MPGGGQAEDGGCRRLLSGGRARVLYWCAGGIDDRKSLGRGLWKEDCGSLAVGVGSHGGSRGNAVRGGVRGCAARAGLRGGLSTKREGIGALGGRDGDCAG